MIFNQASRASVRDAEPQWLAKFVLRIVTLLLSIIAVGCIGWAFGEHQQLYNLKTDAENGGSSSYDYNYDVYDWAFLPWDFITLGLSAIWCTINILFRLSRRRPMSPGLNVAFDLLLWMGLLVTGLFALASAWLNLSYNPSGDSGYGEESRYFTYPNGTTVLVEGHYGEFTNGTYGFIPDSSLGYNNTCVGFSSCAEQNMVVSAASHWGRVVAAGSALTFAAALFHFVTFVWACVDTHRRRATKVDRSAEVIAQRIIADMQERGVIPTYSHNHSLVPNSPGARMQAMPLLGAEHHLAEPASAAHRRERLNVPAHHMNGAAAALHTTSHELDSQASSRDRGGAMDRVESSSDSNVTDGVGNGSPPPALRERHPDHTLHSPPPSRGFHRGRKVVPAPLSLAGSRRVSHESGLPSPGLSPGGGRGNAYAPVQQQQQQRDVSPVSVTPRGSRMRLSNVAPREEDGFRGNTPTGRAM